MYRPPEKTDLRIDRFSIGDIAIVLAVALFPRLLHFAQASRDYWFQTPQLDSRFYLDWARQILSHKGPTDVPFMNPGYAYLLAAINQLLGGPIEVTAIRLQLIVGVASCALVYILAVEIFEDRIAGLFSGVLWATYSVSIFCESLLLSVTWITFFNLVALYAFVMARRESNRGYMLALGSGCCIGISALFRPNILLLAPCMMMCAVAEFMYSGSIKNIPQYQISPERKKQRGGAPSSPIGAARNNLFASITALMVGVLGSLSLASVPGYLRNHKLGITQGNMGINFFIGNNPNADGSFALVPGGSDPQTMMEYYTSQAAILTGEEVGKSDISRFWLKEGLRFVTHHPIRWGALELRKLLLFMNRSEFFLNYPFEVMRERTVLKSLPAFPFLAALGIIGIFLSIRKWPKGIYLHAYLAVYLFTCLVFFVVSEYRLPVVPILAIFSGLSFRELLNLVKNKNLLKVFVGAGLFSVIIGLSYFGAAAPFSASMKFYALGRESLAKGNLRQAIHFYSQVLANNRDAKSGRYMMMAQYSTAHAYRQLGENKLAIQSYMEALRLGAEKHAVYAGIGNVLLGEKKADDAIAAFNMALPSIPQSDLESKKAVLLGLGSAFLLKKQYQETIRYWSQYLELETDRTQAESVFKDIEMLRTQLSKEKK